jgi:hypothetical protein
LNHHIAILGRPSLLRFKLHLVNVVNRCEIGAALWKPWLKVLAAQWVEDRMVFPAGLSRHLEHMVGLEVEVCLSMGVVEVGGSVLLVSRVLAD